MKWFNFSKEQSKFVNDGRISQIVLPLNDETMNIRGGQKFKIFFDGILFSDKLAYVEGVKRTNLSKLTSKDIIRNGFEYKPFFLEHYAEKGIGEDDSIVAVDFSLVRVGDD